MPTIALVDDDRNILTSVSIASNGRLSVLAYPRRLGAGRFKQRADLAIIDIRAAHGRDGLLASPPEEDMR